MKPDSQTILYWDLVYGHWHWIYTPIVTALVFLILLLLLWRPWRWLRTPWQHLLNKISVSYIVLDYMPSRPEPFFPSLAVAGWTTVILAALAIWVDTVLHVWQKHEIVIFLFFLAALAIAYLTFVLEGLEVAYIDLHDKDRQQLEASGAAAAKIFNYITVMGENAFSDAREWAVIALLVIATLLIESKIYYLPFMGVVDDKSPVGLDWLRIGLTVALTAFALVWIAQSPGKNAARKNSVQFLSYFNLFTLKLLHGVWWALNTIGLQYPSDKMDEEVLNQMNRCKEPRKLVPSNRAFYTDSLKKYGYGMLISDDHVTFLPDGSIEVVSRAMHYIGSPRESIKRRFDLEKGFIPLGSPEYTRYHAFEAPLIGEKIEDSQLDIWEKLFYDYNPEQWPSGNEGISTFPTEGWTWEVKIVDPPVNAPPIPEPTFHLTIELSFGQPLPVALSGEENKTALLVIWETKVITKPSAMPLPKGNEISAYPYYKRHGHPCFRSALIATLPEADPLDAGTGYIFVMKQSGEIYKVTYEGIVHPKETARFILQKRDPPIKAKGAPQPSPLKGLKSCATYFMDLSLPAAQYEVIFHIRKLHPVALALPAPGNEAQLLQASPAPALPAGTPAATSTTTPGPTAT